MTSGQMTSGQMTSGEVRPRKLTCGEVTCGESGGRRGWQSRSRPMITPAYARTLAAYNAEMNRRVYAAAARLSDDERRADRGAFWRSIHGTLSHLLWADHLWMARLEGGQRPTVGAPDPPDYTADSKELPPLRQTADAGRAEWAARLE